MLVTPIKFALVKKLWKPFIFFFLISFFIINWVDVSWIFNYRVVSGLVSEIGQKETEEKKVEDIPVISEYYDKENSIEIAKIEISAPLVITDSLDENVLHGLLDEGVLLFPTSVLPGEKGQTVILGHSAPERWPKIKYDWVFSRLDELVEGDEIIIYFNHEKLDYIVRGKYFLERGEEIPENNNEPADNILILISCWPPGKDIRRIAVKAYKTN